MADTAYPATLTFDPPEKVANWRPILNGILAIPHFIVLYVLGLVAEVAALIAWFAIVFTGNLPEGLANVEALYLRYSTRVLMYAAFLREEYPPFTFAASAADPGDDPRLKIDFQPQLADRNRVTVALRIFMLIPALIVLAFVAIAAYIAFVIAFFAVLFTGRWPEGLRNFAVGFMRWSLRVNAYALLLTDVYPPFALD